MFAHPRSLRRFSTFVLLCMFVSLLPPGAASPVPPVRAEAQREAATLSSVWFFEGQVVRVKHY